MAEALATPKHDSPVGAGFNPASAPEISPSGDYAMKIVAVLGSPRPQGNSSTLARAFLKAAGERGAEITEYPLNQMEFKGCQGCGSCKTKSQTCILEDDLTPVLLAVRDADLLLLASPVYFGDLSGQLKCFFDRTYSYFNPDFSCRMPPGKQVVMVLTQANPEETAFDDIFPRYQRWFAWFGFAPAHLLRVTGVRDLGEIASQTAALDAAAALARELVAP
jgi:NAD(P)H-dependent FMN reductase